MSLNWKKLLIGGTIIVTVLVVCIVTFLGFLIKMNKNSVNNNNMLAKPKLLVDTAKKKNEATAFPFNTITNNNNNNTTHADSTKLLPSYETEEEEFMSEDEGDNLTSANRDTIAADAAAGDIEGDHKDGDDEEADHDTHSKIAAKNVASIKFDKTNVVEVGDLAAEAVNSSPESDGVKKNESLPNTRNGKRKIQKEAEIEHDAKGCVGCSTTGQNKKRKKKAASAAQTPSPSGGESNQDASNQGLNHRSPSPQNASKCSYCLTLQKCLRQMMKSMESLIAFSN